MKVTNLYQLRVDDDENHFLLPSLIHSFHAWFFGQKGVSSLIKNKKENQKEMDG